MYIVHILYGEGFLRGTPLHLFQQGVPLSNTKKNAQHKSKREKKKEKLEWSKRKKEYATSLSSLRKSSLSHPFFYFG